jgi:hypothetical protein
MTGVLSCGLLTTLTPLVSCPPPFLSRALKPYADFFCGKPNGISFPYSSDEIRFVAFFLKLVGT